MLKKITLLAAMCSGLALTTPALAQEHEVGFGVGLQYASLIGVEYAYRTEDQRYRFSFGFPGYAVGIEKKFADHDSFSYGFTAGYTDKIFSDGDMKYICLLYTSPSPRDQRGSRMPSSA